MPNALDRVLRLKTLIEEVSRNELEICMQKQRQLENAVSTFKDQERQSRAEAHEGIKSEDAGARMLAEATGALAAWQGTRLNPVARAAADASEVSQRSFLVCRKERFQVGIVLEASAALLAKESERQEQRALDEWFNLQSIRRRSRKRFGGDQSEQDGS